MNKKRRTAVRLYIKFFGNLYHFVLPHADLTGFKNLSGLDELKKDALLCISTKNWDV